MAAYYNEHDPQAAAWLRELIKHGHIAPGDVDERSIEDVRLGQVLMVGNAYDQVVRDILDKVSKPFQATCNFLRSAKRQVWDILADARHQEHEIRRRTGKTSELQDSTDRTEPSFRPATLSLSFLHGIRRPSTVSVHGMFLLTLYCLRAYKHRSRAIYCAAQIESGSDPHTCGNHGLQIDQAMDFFYASELYTGQSNSAGGSVTQTFRCCIQYISVRLSCSNYITYFMNIL